MPIVQKTRKSSAAVSATAEPSVPCAFTLERATEVYCKATSGILARQMAGCMPCQCPSPWRRCIACISEGTGGQAEYSETGLCARHSALRAAPPMRGRVHDFSTPIILNPEAHTRQRRGAIDAAGRTSCVKDADATHSPKLKAALEEILRRTGNVVDVFSIARNDVPQLTKVQLSVLELIASGEKNIDIAAKLGRSAPHVTHILFGIYRKLGLSGAHDETHRVVLRAIGEAYARGTPARTPSPPAPTTSKMGV